MAKEKKQNAGKKTTGGVVGGKTKGKKKASPQTDKEDAEKKASVPVPEEEAIDVPEVVEEQPVPAEETPAEETPAEIETEEKEKEGADASPSSSSFPFERKDLPFSQVQILPTFRNSRRTPGDLPGLMASIMENGLHTPVVVWAHPCEPFEIDGMTVVEQYFLIAGFRRYDAIHSLRLQYPQKFREIPVHIFRGSHEEAADINLTENIQREDLSPLEIGAHMVYLMDTFGWQQKELCDRFSKSQPYVSFLVKMAKGDGVHPDLMELVETGRIPFWTAQSWAYKPLPEQETFVKRYKASLAEEGEGKPPKDKKDKKPPRRRKIRSIQEIQEKLDQYAKMDLSPLSDEQKAHIYGILKGLYWALNNVVEWKPIKPDKWGFEYEPMDD